MKYNRSDWSFGDREKIRLVLALLELKKQGVIFNVWVDAGRVRVQRFEFNRTGAPGQITALGWDRVRELVEELPALRTAANGGNYDKNKGTDSKPAAVPGDAARGRDRDSPASSRTPGQVRPEERANRAPA